MSDNRHSLCCILQRDFSYEEVDRNKYREGLADANNAPQACCKIKPVQLLVKLKSFAARFNYSQLHLWTSRWSQGTHLFVCFVVMTKVLLEESSHYTSGSKKILVHGRKVDSYAIYHIVAYRWTRAAWLRWGRVKVEFRSSSSLLVLFRLRQHIDITQTPPYYRRITRVT